MTKSKRKADEVIKALNRGDDLQQVINLVASSTSEWHAISSSVYNKTLQSAKKRAKLDEVRANVSTAKNSEIIDVLELNTKISEYAMLLPILATTSDLSIIKKLAEDLPNSESPILKRIGKLTMRPRFRVQQKKGRFEQFEPFKPFTKIIDAAYISFLRANFISSYLTLTPLIEGVILRWMGFQPGDKKPEFEDVKKFFSISHRRQPCPNNILFHDVYTTVCDKIITRHLFKPSTAGPSHDDFNRHVASHLLNDNEFATKSNCIRSFMLLDAMSEIYLYETKISDPRFEINDVNIKDEVESLINVMLDFSQNSPESRILGSTIEDLL